MDSKLLNISETSKLMGVCENTLRDWDETGKFRAERTDGGHRRYSLQQIRDYLEENQSPAEELPKQLQPNQEVLDRWRNYLGPGHSPSQQLVLSILLDNSRLVFQMDPQKHNKVISQEHFLWLTMHGWLRSKMRKYVSVQPMLGPTALVFYLNQKGTRLSIESDAVVAKSVLYDFSIFKTIPTPELLETYAQAIGDGIDAFIIRQMEYSNRFNVEAIQDLRACRQISPDFKLKPQFDYIAASEGSLKYIQESFDCEGVELIPIPVAISNSFEPLAVAGKVPSPSSVMNLPVLTPYCLLNFCPTKLSGTIPLAMRCGWFDGPDDKKAKTE